MVRPPLIIPLSSILTETGLAYFGTASDWTYGSVVTDITSQYPSPSCQVFQH